MEKLEKQEKIIQLSNEKNELYGMAEFADGEELSMYEDQISAKDNESTASYFQYDFHLKPLDSTKQALLTRLEKILSNYHVANIFDCEKSSFNLTKSLDQGKMVLASLSQGLLGEEASRLMGAFLLSEVTTHALQRQSIPEYKRTPIFVVIDECQNYLSERIDKILSEARKYRIHLTLSMQFLSQFGENRRLKESVLANTNCKLIGTVSSSDYAKLSKETGYSSSKFPRLKHGRFIAKVDDYPAVIIQADSYLIDTNSKYYISKSQMEQRIKYQLTKYYRISTPPDQSSDRPKKPNITPDSDNDNQPPKINKLL